MCSEVIHYAASVGYHITLLDIGGGFPGNQGSDELFAALAKAIHEELSSNDEYSQLRIIAEPGYTSAIEMVKDSDIYSVSSS